MSDRMKRLKPFLGLFVGVATLVFVALSGRYVDRSDNVYESAGAAPISPIRFEEVSRSLGITFEHHYNTLHFSIRDRPNAQSIATMFPSVSVADFDGDGYYDVFFGSGQRGYPNHMYRNVKGQRFEEVGVELGVANINGYFPTTFAVFADFDRDGRLDIFAAKYGRHQLFLGDAPGRPFRDASKRLQKYFSNANGLGIADLNRDGHLDIVVGNFFEPIDLRKHFPEWVQFGTRNDKSLGGEDDVLWGGPDGSFRLQRNVFTYRSFTHAVGLTDLNRDGYPDVLMANDHATDDLFLNKRGEFAEITGKWLDPNRHGFSSMNSEFFDYDGDGLLDLYITNIHKPPFYRKNNVLWRRRPADQGFEEVSFEAGVARCGYSWGAKFADFDLDGQADLFVINGRNRGAKLKNAQEAYSFWYERFLQSAVPRHLASTYNATIFNEIPENLEFSGFERSCVFRQDKGRFVDVGPSAGVNDLENGRGLALLDYDNDGRVDLAVANVGGPALLYRNVSERQGDWVGFDLDGGSGRRIPFGARLSFTLGRKFVVREVFPTNGMKSQSDPRFVVGLGEQGLPAQVQVEWPDGQREYFTSLTKNSYNRLVYGTGDKSVVY